MLLSERRPNAGPGRPSVSWPQTAVAVRPSKQRPLLALPPVVLERDTCIPLRQMASKEGPLAAPTYQPLCAIRKGSTGASEPSDTTEPSSRSSTQPPGVATTKAPLTGRRLGSPSTAGLATAKPSPSSASPPVPRPRAAPCLKASRGCRRPQGHDRSWHYRFRRAYLNHVL